MLGCQCQASMTTTFGCDSCGKGGMSKLGGEMKNFDENPEGARKGLYTLCEDCKDRLEQLILAEGDLSP